MAYTEEELKKELETKEYEYGFYTDIDSDTFPIGLNENIIRAISKRKEEPEWMTEWRLEAYRAWEEMIEPEWANVHYPKPDFQNISYYSAPNKKPKYESALRWLQLQSYTLWCYETLPFAFHSSLIQLIPALAHRLVCHH